MGTESKTKINRLINQWVVGAPGATSYLAASGFGRDLLVKYKNSGWLEPFGRGAYIRAGDKVGWPGAMSLTIHGTPPSKKQGPPPESGKRPLIIASAASIKSLAAPLYGLQHSLRRDRGFLESNADRIINRIGNRADGAHQR